MNRLRKFRMFSEEAGASAVEFALVLPILVIMLFGFFEVGRLIWSYSVVNAALRDAGRYAARQDVDCTATPPAFTGGAALTNIKRLARTGTVDAGGTPLLPGWSNDATVSVTITCIANPGGTTYAGLYKDLTDVPTVEVYAAVPYTSALNTFLPALSFSSIRARHAQVWTQQ